MDHQAHAVDVGQVLRDRQRAEGVQLHLRVVLGVDFDTAAVLVVVDLQLAAGDRDDVAGAPGLGVLHAQVGGVADTGLGQHQGAGPGQLGNAVESGLHRFGHFVVDRPVAGAHLDQPALERAGRLAPGEAPLEQRVSCRALVGVLARAVKPAGLQHDLARAEHGGLEARGAVLAV